MREEEKEKMGFLESFCMILACYQAFFPIFFCLTAGLLGAFLLIKMFLR